MRMAEESKINNREARLERLSMESIIGQGEMKKCQNRERSGYVLLKKNDLKKLKLALQTLIAHCCLSSIIPS